jgi:hypothetical protein
MVLVAGFALVARLAKRLPRTDRLLDTMPLFCIGATLVLGDHGEAMESLTRIVLVCIAMAYIGVDMRHEWKAKQAKHG